MTMLDELANFVVSVEYGRLSEAARLQAKIRVLDSLGCAIAAKDAELIQQIAALNVEFGGSPLCTLITPSVPASGVPKACGGES